MNIGVANLVRDRAGGCCEYCRLQQRDEQYLRFHVEHVVPRKHGGTDEIGNLALACHKCNRSKGTNIAGIDPQSGQIVPLFHPRLQKWEEHFQMRGFRVEGRTATGRATVEVLNMNVTERLELREAIAGRSRQM